MAERGTPRERPSEFVAILEFLGRTLDYPNFKDKVDATPDQRRKPYHEVWRVMADALGAYGRKGSRYTLVDYPCRTKRKLGKRG